MAEVLRAALARGARTRRSRASSGGPRRGVAADRPGRGRGRGAGPHPPRGAGAGGAPAPRRAGRCRERPARRAVVDVAEPTGRAHARGPGPGRAGRPRCRRSPRHAGARRAGIRSPVRRARSFYAAPVPFALPPLFAPSVGSKWGDRPRRHCGRARDGRLLPQPAVGCADLGQISSAGAAGTDLGPGRRGRRPADEAVDGINEVVDERRPHRGRSDRPADVDARAGRDCRRRSRRDRCRREAAAEIAAAEAAAEAPAAERRRRSCRSRRRRSRSPPKPPPRPPPRSRLPSAAAEAAAERLLPRPPPPKAAEIAAAEAAAAESPRPPRSPPPRSPPPRRSPPRPLPPKSRPPTPLLDRRPAGVRRRTELEAGARRRGSDPGRDRLAEQVEAALAEISADESVQEFLAEADAESGRLRDECRDHGASSRPRTPSRPRSRSWRRCWPGPRATRPR